MKISGDITTFHIKTLKQLQKKALNTFRYIRKYNMKIIKIDWLDEEALEASIVISDGTRTINAFSHPLEFKLFETINVPLNVLIVENVKIVDDAVFLLEEQTDLWDYHIVGKVINRKDGIVCVFDFEICLGYLPSYIRDGEYISCDCTRIELYL